LVFVVFETRVPYGEQRAERVVEDGDGEEAEGGLAVALGVGDAGAVAAKDLTCCFEQAVERGQCLALQAGTGMSGTVKVRVTSST
jgi:hypothetical protein